MSEPIFVVGAPRCGTTLIGRILGNHPHIARLWETHYFERQWAESADLTLLTPANLNHHAQLLYDRVSTIYDPDVRETVLRELSAESLADNASAQGGTHGDLLHAFGEAIAAAENAHFYCDDTPKHIYYLDTIRHFFPTARIIVAVRDPRDFLASYKNMWRVSLKQWQERVRRRYHPIIATAVWRGAYDQLAGRDDYLLISYEQLVSQPEKTTRALCDYIGVPFADEMLDMKRNNSSFDDERRGGIYQDGIGRWQTHLTANELWWVQTLLRRQMRQFGYARQTQSPPVAQLAHDVATLPLIIGRYVWQKISEPQVGFAYFKRRLQTLFLSNTLQFILR